MRRTTSTILIASMSVVPFAIAACGDDDDEPAATEAPAESDAPAETEAPVETDQPVETEAPVETDPPVETDAPVETDPPVEPVQPGLARICPSVEHGDGSSGIWVRGEVYGLEGGWIWVEGPTINGGEPVQVPIIDGAFEDPLPIVAYDDHEIARFELGSDEIDGPVDLLSTLDDGPGRTFPVGPDEGPLFEQECFDFGPPGTTDETDDETGNETVVSTEMVEAFLDRFVDAHVAGDVEDLRATLHPSIPASFGQEVCDAYVEDTVGSITDATLLDVGPLQSFELETPTGVITFPEAAPFSVEFTLVDGSTVTNDANLPLDEGELRWLTTCGVEGP